MKGLRIAVYAGILAALFLFTACSAPAGTKPSALPSVSVVPSISVVPSVSTVPSVSAPPSVTVSVAPSAAGSLTPSVTNSVAPSVVPSTAPSMHPSLPQTLAETEAGYLYEGAAELAFYVSPSPLAFSVQGACVVKDELFIASLYRMEDGSERVRIIVCDMQGNVKTVSEELSLEHANNLTYLPKEDRILVTHCQPTFNRYSKLDPDTLQVIETGTLPYNFAAMAYSPERDAYVSLQGAGEYLDVWNADLSHAKRKAQTVPVSITQGIYCDANAVYCVRYNPSEILCFDWDLNFTHKIVLSFDFPGAEPECAFVWQENTYVLCNVSGLAFVYKITAFTKTGTL